LQSGGPYGAHAHSAESHGETLPKLEKTRRLPQSRKPAQQATGGTQ
jgi:hypothetical protein